METDLAVDAGEDNESAVIDLGTKSEDEDSGKNDTQADESDSQEKEETEESVGEVSEPDEDPQEIIARLKAEKEKAEKDRDRAFYNLRNAKKTEKKESKEPEFTDAQLLDLIETHREDPAVMLQIMKQVSKQQSGIEAESKIKSKDIESKKQNIDTFLATNYGRFIDDGTPEYQDVQKAKEFLHLDDHPLSDFLAIASMQLSQLPNIIEHVKKQAVEEALKKNGEKSRKKAIKETSTGESKPTKKVVATDDDTSQYLATAKQMGLDKEQTKKYLQMVQNAKKRSIIVNE
jgi:hypothetical protein